MWVLKAFACRRHFQPLLMPGCMGTGSDWRHPEGLVLLHVSGPMGPVVAGHAYQGCSGHGQSQASI